MVTRLPITNIARLVRFPTLGLEWERLNQLAQFLLRFPDLADRYFALEDEEKRLYQHCTANER